AAGDPNLGVHDDGRVEADHVDDLAVRPVAGSADDVVPPGVLEVALELHAQRAVIPEAIDAAVDFRRLPDEAAPPAQGDDVVHGLAGVGDTRRFGGHAHIPVPRKRTANVTTTGPPQPPAAPAGGVMASAC